MPLTSTRLHETFPLVPTGDIAGMAILGELPRGVGMQVTRVYRAVMLWAADPPEERSCSVFAEGSMASLATKMAAATQVIGDAIGQPLILIACELAQDEPEIRQIAKACLSVVDWALARRASATAIAFAEAAALTSPNARYSLIAGRLHRQCGRQDQAHRWLRRASVLATRVGDSLTKVRSLLSLGSVAMIVGQHRRAEDYFRRALRFATRYRLQELVGEAWHDLFTIAITTNNYRAADAALKEAVRRYKRGHHRLPAFAHDLATYWMERDDFENARLVLLALLEKHWRNDPGLRLLACGTTLRALGGCARAEEFDKTFGEFCELADKASETRWLAPAMLKAALGAISLRRWTLAESLLTTATQHASRTGQHDTILDAERILGQVRAKRDEPRQISNPQVYREVARMAVLALGGGEARL
jgi:hypothetical protein